jgi:hypothetical protein
MDVDQLIPWRIALREYLAVSPSGAWRRERVDPQFAALKLRIGPGRFGARLSAIQEYISTRPPAGFRAKPKDSAAEDKAAA